MGLVSAAAVLSDVLLIVPVAAIVVALVAIYQVRNSGGTQSGTGLAAIGILLAIVFMGWVVGRAWAQKRAIVAEERQIVALIDQLSQQVLAKDYDAAWKHFGRDFRYTVTKAGFVNTWKALDGLEGYGPVKGLRWNTRLAVQIDPNTGTKLANGVILVDTVNGAPDRWGATFRYYPGTGWMIEDVDAVYFAKRPLKSELELPTPIRPDWE